MSNERQINYVNEIQNRVQNLYYVDDASELNSINLKENDKIYAINDNKLFQMEIVDQDEELSGSIVSFNGRNNTKIKSVVTNIELIQDLHGMPNPYPAGGSVNLIPDGTDTNNGYVASAYLKADGTITSSANWNICEYIALDDETTYTWSNRVNTTGAPSICFYDENKEFISGISMDNQYSHTFTPPEGTVYCRSSQTKYPYQEQQSHSAFQLEVGSTATEYRRYSNICPISGRTGANITGSGKNLLPPAPAETKTSDGITVTSDGKGRYHISGTATGSSGRSVVMFDLEKMITIPVSIGEGGNGAMFFLNSAAGTNSVFVTFYYNNTQVESWVLSSVNRYSTTYIGQGGKKINRIGIEVVYNRTVDVTLSPMFTNDGTTKMTSLVEFTGYNNLPINWQTEAGTIYGGSVEVIGGALESTMGMVDLGDLNWSRHSGSGNFVATISDIKPFETGISQEMLSSMYRRVSDRSTAYAAPNGSMCRYNSSDSKIVIFSNSNYETASDFKAAMSGVQLCYELATPIEYIVSPNEITTLLGTNNIWSDIGDITVKIAEKGITAFELEPYI